MNCSNNLNPIIYLNDACGSKTESSDSAICEKHKDDETSLSSESGWTIYLGESTPLSFLNTDVCHQNKASGAFSESYQHHSHLHDDPSMASDASSGPEHPISCQESVEQPQMQIAVENSKKTEHLQSFHDNNSSKSTRSWGSDLPGTQYEEVKRQKKQHDQEVQQQFTKNIQEGKDQVGDRLVALQRLIPHSQELGQEELLTVASDYVKSLEGVVNNYLKLEPHAFQDKTGEHINADQENSLQDKGFDPSLHIG